MSPKTGMDIENPTNSREKELQIVIRSPLKVPDGWLVEQRSRPNRNPNHADIVDKVTFFSLPLNLIIHSCMHACIFSMLIVMYHTIISCMHPMHTYIICVCWVRTYVHNCCFWLCFETLSFNFKFNTSAM